MIGNTLYHYNLLHSKLSAVPQNVLDPSPLNLSATGAHLQAVILSWIPSLSSLPLMEDIYETYTLTVMRSNAQPQILPCDQPGCIFNASKGVPPCALYNFTATATYSGARANYNGAGCNVHSTVVNVMLPSLPDIGRTESSLDYVLEKRSTSMGFELRVSFLVSS